MKALRCLSLAVVLLMPLPALLVADRAAFADFGFIRFLLYYAVIAGVFFVGKLTGSAVKSAGNGKKLPAAKAAAFCIGAVLAICPVAVCFAFALSSASAFVYPLIVIFIYFSGYASVRRGDAELLSPFTLTGCGIVVIACYFIYGALAEENAAPGQLCIVLTALVIAAASVFVFNQRNISLLYARRSANPAEMPRNIRRFNLLLTGGFCGIFLLLFLFCGPLSGALTELFKAIVRGIILFFESLFAGGIEGDDEAPDFSESGSYSPLSAGNDALILLLYVVTAVVVLAGLFFAVRAVIRFIAEKLHSRPSVAENLAEGYTDYLTFERERSGDRGQSFRRAVKAYRKETDPALKYRSGYRAFMLWLAQRGCEPFFSDTAETHLTEAAQILPDCGFPPEIVAAYSELRYNDGAVSAEQTEKMEQFILTLERNQK